MTPVFAVPSTPVTPVVPSVPVTPVIPSIPMVSNKIICKQYSPSDNSSDMTKEEFYKIAVITIIQKIIGRDLSSIVKIVMK